MKKYNNMAIALILLGVLASITALAESSEPFPEEEWNRTYRNAGNSSAYSVQQTADGGYLISGSTCSYEPWQCSPWLLRTDEDGNEQWNKTFSSNYGARSILQTRDDGYIFADRSLVKIDVNGSEQWAKTIDGTIYSVQETSDGGYIGAGIIPEEPGSEHPNGWLIKVDENGDEVWNRTFWGRGFGIIESVEQTMDGGYVLAGIRANREDGGGALLIKVDSNGNELWNRTFGEWNRTFGGRGEMAYSVRKTKDGSYIIAGTTFSSAGGSYTWLRKVEGEQTGTAKTQDASPTIKTSPVVTLTASLTRTMIVIPTENHTEKPLEKAAGFEAIPGMTILLAVYAAGRKKR